MDSPSRDWNSQIKTKIWGQIDSKPRISRGDSIQGGHASISYKKFYPRMPWKRSQRVLPIVKKEDSIDWRSGRGAPIYTRLQNIHRLFRYYENYMEYGFKYIRKRFFILRRNLVNLYFKIFFMLFSARVNILYAKLTVKSQFQKFRNV